MGTTKFSPMAIDAIGEIFNISLGSSATAVSDMLNRRVEISTPRVEVVAAKEFELGDLDPAVGVKIDYVAGLSGSNIMLLRRDDVHAIVDILMGMETSDEEFELNELNTSAVCEVMNQMMGAASTAMSDFLGRAVNISTPEAVQIQDLDDYKRKYFTDPDMVIIRFKLQISDSVESEFVSAISIYLARELLEGFGIGGEDVGLTSDGREISGFVPTDSPAPEPAAASDGADSTPAPAAASGGVMSQDEIEKLLGGGTPATSTPTPAPAAASGGMMSQDEIEKLLVGDGAAAAPAPTPTPAPTPQQPAAAMSPQQPAAGMPPQGMPQQPAAGMPQQPYGMPPQGMPQQPGMPPQGMQQGMPGYGGYPPYPQYPYPYGGYPMYGMPPYGMPMPASEPEKPKEKSEPARTSKTIHTVSPKMRQLDNAGPTLSNEQSENLNLIMSVPVDVSVEIGRTSRKVREILGYTKGSLVVLERLAGDPVDLYVNGKCIARGDVVVVDDNFGLRITEIIQPFEINEVIP